MAWAQERADAGTALQLAELGRKGEKLEMTMRKIAVMKSRLMKMDRCPVDYAWDWADERVPVRGRLVFSPGRQGRGLSR